MYKYQDRKVVPYCYKKVFSVIIDVDKYHSFIPWCKKVIIISKSENFLVAEMHVKFATFKKKYISEVSIKEEDSIIYIDIVARKGLFKTLKYNWKLQKIEDNISEISCNVVVEFSSNILNKVLFFSKKEVSEKIINAFFNRCKKLYGSESSHRKVKNDLH